MNENAIEIVEGEVQTVLASHLQRIEPQLGERGLRAESKPIARHGSGDRYESEVCVYFWRGSELVDALEFHIARGGVIVANKADVEPWLAQHLATISEEGGRVAPPLE